MNRILYFEYNLGQYFHNKIAFNPQKVINNDQQDQSIIINSFFELAY